MSGSKLKIHENKPYYCSIMAGTVKKCFMLQYGLGLAYCIWCDHLRTRKTNRKRGNQKGYSFSSLTLEWWILDRVKQWSFLYNGLVSKGIWKDALYYRTFFVCICWLRNVIVTLNASEKIIVGLNEYSKINTCLSLSVASLITTENILAHPFLCQNLIKFVL